MMGSGGSLGGSFSMGGAGGTAGSAGAAGGSIGATNCPDVGLAAADPFPNVVADAAGGDVRIRFDPLEKAQDYRVYVLPKQGDVAGDNVKNATYRCAGNYEVPLAGNEDQPVPNGGAIRTRIASKVQGFTRAASDATLGYVFTTPSADRVPVYALGDPDVDSDNVACYFARWPESRVKAYITSDDDRTKRLDQHWRDHGVAFYAPKPGAAGTTQVYLASDMTGSKSDGPLYVTPGAEYDARKMAGKVIAPAFAAYSTQLPGSEPLRRVYYEQACGRGHDELVAGMARFNKAYKQGSQPIPELHYSGIAADTTLVVEALDRPCPFQGVLSPLSRAARSDPFNGFNVDYPAFMTLDQLRQSGASGEAYINGEGPASTPHAIARSCVKVSPSALPKMDWRYEGQPETYSTEKQVTFQGWTLDSPTFDFELLSVATNEWGFGSMLGELWVTYGDWAADTNGKFRATPKTLATLSADKFVHATAAVDAVSSDRRYPQIWISDQKAPVQDNMMNGGTIVVQTRGGITSPIVAEIQFCDHRVWDVNNQCPLWELLRLNDGTDFLSPREEINGIDGVDRTILFDVYASTSRVYLFTNGLPYGCVDLPAGKIAAGPATVTFGDVLYHSGVDLADWYPYHLTHMHSVTSRHFSNLGFSSNVSAPTWNEMRVPCVAAGKLK
jgi:hypothetical protein